MVKHSVAHLEGGDRHLQEPLAVGLWQARRPQPDREPGWRSSALVRRAHEIPELLDEKCAVSYATRKVRPVSWHSVVATTSPYSYGLISMESGSNPLLFSRRSATVRAALGWTRGERPLLGIRAQTRVVAGRTVAFSRKALGHRLDLREDACGSERRVHGRSCGTSASG